MFFNSDGIICVYNGNKIFLRRLGELKTDNISIFRTKIPSIFNYITRRDRIAYLQFKNNKLSFVASYGVFNYSMTDQTVQKVLDLKSTRTIFQSSFVNFDESLYFFDYSSNGLQGGIELHSSNNNGESWHSSTVIKKGICQRVISCHYLHLAKKIIVSTGDEAAHCRVYLFCPVKKTMNCIASGSEDFRFMNVISENNDLITWISNNRVAGSAMITFDISTGKYDRSEIFETPTNIWHTAVIGKNVYAAETIEPVAFNQNKKIIRVFLVSVNKSEVLSVFNVSGLKKIFRFPSIEFLKTGKNQNAFLLTGTTQDGVYNFSDSGTLPFSFLDYCLENNDQEVKVWSLRTKEMMAFWRKLVKKNNIQETLGASVDLEFRKKNIIEKCKDYL